MTVGNRIKALRTEKGLSVNDLSEKTGFHRSVIYYYESGKNVPSTLALSCLADVLGVTVDYLLGRCAAPDEQIRGSYQQLLDENRMLKLALAKVRKLVEVIPR